MTNFLFRAIKYIDFWYNSLYDVILVSGLEHRFKPAKKKREPKLIAICAKYVKQKHCAFIDHFVEIILSKKVNHFAVTSNIQKPSV